MKKTFHTSGFTLLETLVAIAMLSIVIAVVTGMIQTSLQADAFARDQITAKYLAEEGIEYIRNIRDTNAINDIPAGAHPWLDGIAQGTKPCGDLGNASTVRTCMVDPITNGIPTQCTGDCPILHYDTITGQYSYNTDMPPSKFTRSISVEGIDGQSNDPDTAYSAVVHSTITWNENLSAQTYTADEYLFKWYAAQ